MNPLPRSEKHSVLGNQEVQAEHVPQNSLPLQYLISPAAVDTPNLRPAPQNTSRFCKLQDSCISPPHYWRYEIGLHR